MLKITAKAAARLVHTRDERGFDASFGARFVRGTNGVGLTFAAGPRRRDRVLDEAPLPVYIAQDLAPILDHAVIDETTDDRGSRLVVRQQEEAPAPG
ncbi:MAG TPA: hypothetical protein VIA82_06425 [Candidatus Limnocylindria bacterium]|jgi:Fe-S cluster assembly iron-binding protein IscA